MACLETVSTWTAARSPWVGILKRLITKTALNINKVATDNKTIFKIFYCL